MFKDIFLRQENIDLVFNTIGAVINSDMEITKKSTTIEPLIRYVSSGSGEHVLCSVYIKPTYYSDEFEYWCQYLDDIGNQNNDIYRRKQSFLWKGNNYVQIELKCSKGRKIQCSFKIFCDENVSRSKEGKFILNIEEKFNCGFKTSSGEYIKHIHNFMQDINRRIDELMPSIVLNMSNLKDNLTNKIIEKLVRDPKLINVLKGFPHASAIIDKNTDDGASKVDSMLDAGFFD